MSRKSLTVPGMIVLDCDALASMGGTALDADLLRRIERLLLDCRERLDAGGRLLWSAKEVAERFGVCERTVTGAAGRKEIDVTRIGSRVLFSRDAIEKYIAQNTTNIETPAEASAAK